MADTPTDVKDGGAVPGGPENIVEHRLIEEMQDSYLNYSMSVSEAIPEGNSHLHAVSRPLGKFGRERDRS